MEKKYILRQLFWQDTNTYELYNDGTISKHIAINEYMEYPFHKNAIGVFNNTVDVEIALNDLFDEDERCECVGDNDIETVIYFPSFTTGEIKIFYHKAEGNEGHFFQDDDVMEIGSIFDVLEISDDELEEMKEEGREIILY